MKTDMFNRRMTKEDAKRYEELIQIEAAENDMLLAAEKYLKAHGYTVTFNHRKRK